jgi:hypothetical protein
VLHRPAYAPTHFIDREILWTIPYSMPGELVLGPNETGVPFPEPQFMHNVDKPFEIWRMIARTTGMVGPSVEDAVVSETQPLTLDRRVRLAIQDTSKNERVTKNPQLISSFQKANEMSWEWDPRPYTIIRQEGLQVMASTQGFPSVCAPNADCEPVLTPITFTRIEVTFEGWLLVLAPPSNTRG